MCVNVRAYVRVCMMRSMFKDVCLTSVPWYNRLGYVLILCIPVLLFLLFGMNKTVDVIIQPVYPHALQKQLKQMVMEEQKPAAAAAAGKPAAVDKPKVQTQKGIKKPRIKCSTISDELQCEPNQPCMYEDEVDLRIIVLVYDRSASLQTALDHLQHLELDGATAKMEIWLDCGKDGTADKTTYDVASSYTWAIGRSRVHVWKSHVGIYGQFTDTWGTRVGTREAAIFVEDDVDVAPMGWRWLRAARERYNNVNKIAGYGLRQKYLPSKTNKFLGNSTVSLKRYVESWGFAPKAHVYTDFQNWFHEVRKNKTFRPVLKDAPVRTGWFKSSEKKESMWSMWFHYYLHMNDIYMMYPNFKKMTGNPQKVLDFNREEKGLHYSGRGNKALLKKEHLLDTWDEKYVQFPDKIKILNYNTNCYGTLDTLNNTKLPC